MSFSSRKLVGVYKQDVNLNTRQILSYSLISILIFLSCFAITKFSDQISRPIVRWTNSFSGNYPTFDRICLDFALYNTFSGAVLCGLILSNWLKKKSIREKSRIFVGTCTAFGAGVVSRFLQHHLSTHIRPYYDKAVNFKPLPGLNTPSLNTWNSFPSDHAAVFGGLVAVLFVAKAKERYYIAFWILIVESSRTFIGAHFPSDLIGGAALSSALVWLFQYKNFVKNAEWICMWEIRAPIFFYTAFFMLLYQISTLFEDVRNMTGGFTIFNQLG